MRSLSLYPIGLISLDLMQELRSTIWIGNSSDTSLLSRAQNDIRMGFPEHCNFIPSLIVKVTVLNFTAGSNQIVCDLQAPLMYSVIQMSMIPCMHEVILCDTTYTFINLVQYYK